jgi:fructose-1,6-bisphosphatase I
MRAWRRHVLSEQFRLGEAATGDFTLLLTAIQTTCKFIAMNVRRARLINLCARSLPACCTR